MADKKDSQIIMKQELGCIGVLPVIRYLENRIGKNETKVVIESLGISYAYITDKSKWISYDFYLKLLRKLIEVTNDEEAPYKSGLFIKPQNFFDFVEFSAYSIFWTGSPKLIYHIGLTRKFYRRWTKIEDYEIVSYKKNSMIVKHSLKNGYKHDQFNSKAFQGFLAGNPTALGLPPAKVELLEGDINGYGPCIYEVTWINKLNCFPIFSILFFCAVILSEFFFFRKIFNVYIFSIMGILVYFLFFFIIQSYKNWKKILINQNVNERQNLTLLQEMKARENDYKELLKTKLMLEQRSLFLSIHNEILKSIANATRITPLLQMITREIVNKLKLQMGTFFQYDRDFDYYHSLFVLFKNDQFIDPEKLINLNIKRTDVEKLDAMENFFHADKLKEIGLESDDLRYIIEYTKDLIIYYIPIDFEELYQGFYVFTADQNTSLSKDLLLALFDNIKTQLKIGYTKIISRMTIENILSSIPAYVVIFSINNYDIKYVNSIFKETFPHIKSQQDVSNDSVIGKNLFSILPFDNDAKHSIIDCLEKQNITRNINQLDLDRIEDKFETQIGQMIIEYKLFSIPRYQEQEKLVGIIMNDITEAKHFQRTIFINEKLIALGKVASGIAHEINNPLYAVLANAEEIIDDEDNSENSRQYAEEIVDHVINVSNIIKDLSAYSKTLRNEEYDDINLNNVIEDSLKIVRYSSNFLEIEVEKKLNFLPTMRVLKGEMQQVFINLFNNAMQAMNGKGKISVHSSFKNDIISIKVGDTGEGIPRENLNKIFELFFTTKKEVKGTGQGLHIVKKIINHYNGQISVESEVNQGTIFIITFKI